MVWALLAASEATTASKHPWRSNLTSDLKLVTQITYAAMSLQPLLFLNCLIIIFEASNCLQQQNPRSSIDFAAARNKRTPFAFSPLSPQYI